MTVDGPEVPPARSLATRIAQAVAAGLGRLNVAVPLPAMVDHWGLRGFDGLREITATVHREREVIQILPGRRERTCGIAVDIGTTSFVVFLCDLERGEVLDMRTAGNPQAI